MIIIPSLRLGYQPAPKIATTSMFDWLFACLGPEAVADLPTRGGKANAVRNYFLHECGDIRRVANSPDAVAPYRDYLRFTITRDPIRRFLSMYANRVVHHGELGPKSDAAKGLRAAGLPFNPGINLLVERMEEYFEVARSIRHHSLPMVHFLGTDFSIFDRVLDISGVPALLEEIRTHWAAQGLDALARQLPPMPRRQTGGPKLDAQVLKEASFEKLMAFYAEDYRVVPTIDAARARADYTSSRRTARAAGASLAPLPPMRWPVLAEIDKGALEAGAGRGQLGGVVVLAARAPEGVSLRMRVDDTDIPLTWGLPSPHAAKRFPGAANAASARFRATALPASGGQLRLEIEHAASGQSACVLQGMLAPARWRLRIEEVRGRLATLETDDLPPRGIHTELRMLLDVTPKALRGIAWHEASVLLDARFRMNAQDAFRSLEKIRELHAVQGKPECFEAFWRELRTLLDPLTLTSHGYTRSLARRDESAVWQGVQAITAELEALGHRAFINSGTLLGAVRECSLIGHDDDVDLAVILRGEDAGSIAAEWVDLRLRLAAQGLLDASFEERREMHCKLRRAAGVSVDLFPAWVMDGQAFVWPHTFGDVPASALLPLGSMDIAGASVPVPRDSEALLAVNYGPDWRNPDPTFRFPWGQAARRFRVFIDAFKAEQGKP